MTSVNGFSYVLRRTGTVSDSKCGRSGWGGIFNIAMNCWRAQTRRALFAVGLLLFSAHPALAESSAALRVNLPLEPAVPQHQPVRTVHIDMQLISFATKSITVTAGETIRFVIRNMTEAIPHEFTIGTKNMQQGRRELLDQMSRVAPFKDPSHDSDLYRAPNAVVVMPGETRELIWTFTETQKLEFGCNIPGHYESGMKGDFQVLATDDDERQVASTGTSPDEASETDADAGQSETDTVPGDDDGVADATQQLNEGHELMAKGYVLEARERYTRSLDAGLAEAALALARSFDPRAVSRLELPNAAADSDQARQWYEEWYRISVEQGVISPAIKLGTFLAVMEDR